MGWGTKGEGAQGEWCSEGGKDTHEAACTMLSSDKGRDRVRHSGCFSFPVCLHRD